MSTKKFFGLGKGLNSLIPEKHIRVSVPAVPAGRQSKQDSVFYIETHKIVPNPDQPRRDFDKESLSELAASIKKFGILQPLLASKVEKPMTNGIDFEYQLLAGERRLRAAQLLGLPHVPVIVNDSFDNDRKRLEAAMIENIQREDLNPLEEAVAYKRFADEFGLTQNQIAEKVSKSREVITNAMRLLTLPSDIQESIRAGKVTHTQARSLLMFKDREKQKQMYQAILSGAVSVRDMEAEARSVKANAGNSSAKKTESKFRDLESNLAKSIGAPVLIQSGANGGKITIRFATLEDLNKIAKTILD